MQIITIKQIDNGYIIENEYPDIEGANKEIFVVSEFWDKESEKEFKTNDEEKLTFGRMLYLVADKMGFSYDKFSKENLNITWDKPGHKI